MQTFNVFRFTVQIKLYYVVCLFLIFGPLTDHDFYHFEFEISTEINGFYVQRHLT